jgi:chromosome segregation ATPase
MATGARDPRCVGRRLTRSAAALPSPTMRRVRRGGPIGRAELLELEWRLRITGEVAEQLSAGLTHIAGRLALVDEQLVECRQRGSAAAQQADALRTHLERLEADRRDTARRMDALRAERGRLAARVRDRRRLLGLGDGS